MKIYEHHLTDNDVIDLLTVHVYESNVYLVELKMADVSSILFNRGDRPVRFCSSQQIREAFSKFSVRKAIMVHDSPYDEMIGNPEKTYRVTALPFSMNLPY